MQKKFAFVAVLSVAMLLTSCGGKTSSSSASDSSDSTTTSSKDTSSSETPSSTGTSTSTGTSSSKAKHSVAFTYDATLISVTDEAGAALAATYEEGTVVKFKVSVTNSNYGDPVVKNGSTVLTATAGVYSVTASEDLTITITTSIKTYTVTISTGDKVTAKFVDDKKVELSSQTGVYEIGKTVYFTLTGVSGYTQLKDLTVTIGTSALTPTDGLYSIANITENKTVTVAVSADVFHIVVKNGKINGKDTEGDYPADTAITLTPTYATNCIGWRVADNYKDTSIPAGVSDDATWEFYPSKDLTVAAWYGEANDIVGRGSMGSGMSNTGFDKLDTAEEPREEGAEHFNSICAGSSNVDNAKSEDTVWNFGRSADIKADIKTLDFDLRAENWVGGVRFHIYDGANASTDKNFEGSWICLDGKDSAGNDVPGTSVTKLYDGWYHYHFDILNYIKSTNLRHTEEQTVSAIANGDTMRIGYETASTTVTKDSDDKTIDHTAAGVCRLDNVFFA